MLVVLAGLTVHRTRDWGSMERLARSSLAAYPGGSEVWEQLGVSLRRDGRLAAAAEALARSASLNPVNPRPVTLLAETLAELGRHDEAVPAWHRAAALVPEAGVLWRGLGRSLRLSGNPAAGVEPLERAHALMPADPRTLNELVLALLESDRPGDAVRALERGAEAVAHDPQALEPLRDRATLRLARARLAEGRAADALRLATEVVARGRLPAEGLYLAGLVALHAGEPARARAWLDQATRVDPELLERKRRRALELEAAGRLSEAIGEIEEILAARPGDRGLLLDLDRLRREIER
jgi:tetratricopeptide (TPR) repeat protein